MREEPGLLREISNVSLVQRKRRRKELEVPQFHIAIIRFLDSSNAGKDGAFSRAGSSEQPQGTAFVQFQRDIDGDLASFFYDVRFKHGVGVEPGHALATEVGGRQRGILQAMA